jgi:hypothetical protein
VSTLDSMAAMSRRPLSRGEVAFIIGVPAAWAILLLFHPSGGGSIYLDLQDNVARWLIVHIGMLIFIPLFAAAVYVLMRDVGGDSGAGQPDCAHSFRHLLRSLRDVAGDRGRHSR